jgi:hypothetical protein
VSFFTAGPWRSDVVILDGGAQGFGVFATFADERRRHVATCHGWDARENAELIATAPDLLARLRLEHGPEHPLPPYRWCETCAVMRRAGEIERRR